MKPCPVCGGRNAYIGTTRDTYFAECLECCNGIGYYKTRQEAINAWNKWNGEDMDKNKMMPCPFCGGEAEISHKTVCMTEYSFVQCKECKAAIGRIPVSAAYCSDQRAIETWNTRVSDRG